MQAQEHRPQPVGLRWPIRHVEFRRAAPGSARNLLQMRPDGDAVLVDLGEPEFSLRVGRQAAEAVSKKLATCPIARST